MLGMMVTALKHSSEKKKIMMAMNLKNSRALLPSPYLFTGYIVI